MTTLFKDLTLEQQRYLVGLFEKTGYIPKDATHIDAEDTSSVFAEAILKCEVGEQFFLNHGKWTSANSINAVSFEYYPIPDDFNRQTGEIMNMDKPLLTEPFVNPLITEDCYVDVQGWTETEVKLAAEIFAKSTGRKIWDHERALHVGSHWKYLGCNEEDHGILVNTGKLSTELTKDQVFWPELPTQPDFPDFDFKLSCGDSPEVRQWLKDNGCVWYLGGCPLSVQTDKGYLYVRNRMIAWDHKTDWMIDSRNLPVIQPTFTVTGFTVPESEKKRKETLDKIKEKEDTIKRLTDEINQLKQENQTND